MKVEALQRARDALHIQDVFVREYKVRLSDQYDPKLYHQTHPTTQSQFAWGAESGELRELKNEESSQTSRMWRLRFKTLFRLLKDVGSPLPERYEPKNEEILAEIEAVFITEYVLQKDLDEEALTEFAQHNVAYHVWPYWRELLHSIQERVLMPRVTLPMYGFTNAPGADQKKT